MRRRDGGAAPAMGNGQKARYAARMKNIARAWAAWGVGVATWFFAPSARAEVEAQPAPTVEYQKTTLQAPLTIEAGATTHFEWFDPEHVAQLSVTAERFLVQPSKPGRVVLRRHSRDGSVALTVIDVRAPLRGSQLPAAARSVGAERVRARIAWVPKIAAARKLLLTQHKCRQAQDAACVERVQGEIEQMREEQPGSFEAPEPSEDDSIGVRK